ncbi:hypothetical protein SNEBB_011007 [Seison nebaliae]|nr:hypothetical protein SNEBB_011007 [Seison nebaliae]
MDNTCQLVDEMKKRDSQFSCHDVTMNLMILYSFSLLVLIQIVVTDNATTTTKETTVISTTSISSTISKTSTTDKTTTLSSTSTSSSTTSTISTSTISTSTISTSPISTSPISTSTISTIESTTSSSTTSTISTIESTTSPTPTPTPGPTSTSEKTSTTTEIVTSTEEITTTTTEVPVTTTIPPIPERREVVKFSLPRFNKTHACMFGEMALVFKIPYQKKLENGDVIIAVTEINSTKEDYECSGACSPISQELELAFYRNDVRISFFFEKKMKDEYLSNVTLDYNLRNDRLFPNAVHNNSRMVANAYNLKRDKKVDGSSYLCRTGESVELQSNSEQIKQNITVVYDDLHYETFADGSLPYRYGAAIECEGDQKVSNEIPIIVGVCLAVLIIVVFAAYMIGKRKRTQYDNID